MNLKVTGVGHAAGDGFNIFVYPKTGSYMYYVNTQNQICPDDSSYSCYTPIDFTVPQKIKKGSWFQVCLEELTSGDFNINCKDKKVKNTKVFNIAVGVPQ